ncbi:MAG: hypothetical protein H0V46_08955, partial [Sphingomonas sp.]|nr:hypothetical protein [Sphingomonas sp.]
MNAFTAATAKTGSMHFSGLIQRMNAWPNTPQRKLTAASVAALLFMAPFGVAVYADDSSPIGQAMTPVKQFMSALSDRSPGERTAAELTK